MTGLIEPYGGVLKTLYMSSPQQTIAAAAALPSWELTPRQSCDLELLMSGAFSPLEGFMTEADYRGVVRDMRLASGVLWPIPIVLDVTPEFARKLPHDAQIVLRDPEGVPLALLEVTDQWVADKREEAQSVYGTADTHHPGVRMLLEQTHAVYLGGRVRGLERPVHFDFTAYRHSPAELRAIFRERGWQRVVAFQTRNPMHRAHVELTRRAARLADANVLIQPAVGMTKPGDVEHATRVRCYQKVLHHLPADSAALSLLPLSMRMAGPREALWHAIIRRNYGCTHFIVGRDHAGPGKDRGGGDYYAADAAQALAVKHESELGIAILPFQEMAYVESRGAYVPADELGPHERALSISGTAFRRQLLAGDPIPEWFSYPEVVEELRRTYLPKHRQGVTVFFTGLSGAGKSTIAKALLARLLETGGRSVTLLDGDIVRSNLSSELGFSRAHRDLNIQRIGFVANEITKHGGIAICAPIAPYAAMRDQVRRLVSAHGGFIEVYVSTPLAVCETRDRKGLYAKARAGLIKEFTGISDPYEAPANPELEIDTRDCSPLDAAAAIYERLEQEGYVQPLPVSG
jgi:sulfate adenylyltransferase